MSEDIDRYAAKPDVDHGTNGINYKFKNTELDDLLAYVVLNLKTAQLIVSDASPASLSDIILKTALQSDKLQRDPRAAVEELLKRRKAAAPGEAQPAA